MSVLNGYAKYKRYVKKDTGYQLCSHWTSSNTVHFDDGKTAQEKLGAINGITDSLTATSSNVALSSKAGNSLQSQINELNTGIVNAASFSAASIEFNAHTGMASPQYVFKVGNIAILRILTHETIINANAVLFTMPNGYRPLKKQTVRAHFTRLKDGLRGSYSVALNQDGTIISSFNDDGETWDIDLFYIYICA